MKRRDLLRILDANFNRSREGLRVCEEIVRFVLEDAVLTRSLKKVRHELTACLKGIDATSSEILGARDVLRDVGKKSAAFETSRSGACDLFAANIERTKEAVRVLEEISKVFSAASQTDRFSRIRCSVYAIEKKIMPRLEALCDYLAVGVRQKGSYGNRKAGS